MKINYHPKYNLCERQLKASYWWHTYDRVLDWF